ncbi:hypothetical protein Sste5344_008385 [Sporothrix stenoceras]
MPIRRGRSIVDLAPLSQPLPKTKTPSPQRRPVVQQTPDKTPDDQVSTSDVHKMTTSSTSPVRVNNDSDGKTAPRKSHPVTVVRLMRPIEPAPLSKSSLYTPYALTGAPFSRYSPIRAPALKEKPAASVEQSTPKAIKPTLSSASSCIKSVGESSPANRQFESSPETAPRKSLPPYASHEPPAIFSTESAKTREEAVKPGKDIFGARHKAVQENQARVPKPLGLGPKAASVADLRKIFDRPSPNNMSTHSMPKLSPVKQYKPKAFGRSPVKEDKLCSEITKSPKLPEPMRTIHHSSSSSSSSDESGVAPPKHEDSPPAEIENKFGSVPRSKLRAFLRAKRSSGSWRRLSSHLLRRSSHDHSSSTGNAAVPEKASVGSKSYGATSNDHGERRPLAKSDPLATSATAHNALSGQRRSWVWGHPQRAKEQSGAAFHFSEGSAGLDGNNPFRRVSGEGRFGSWSWGHRKTSKGALSNVNNNSGDTVVTPKDAQDSSTDTFIGHFDKTDPSSTDARIISASGIAAATARSPMVGAEADCELRHPRPVRVDDLQRLATLCKKRERTPSLSYLFGP